MGTERTPDQPIERARALLRDIAGRHPARAEIEQAALALAGELFDAAEARVDTAERSRRARLSRLLSDPAGQLLSVLLTDRVARDKTFRHTAGQLNHLVRELGLPRFMNFAERAQLELGRALGDVAPGVVGRLVARRIRQEVEGLVFPTDEKALRAYLEERESEGVRVNLNQLGEEVLGEEQALRRLDQYIALLERPYVHTISVKLSSIFSQVDLFAWEATREKLAERLRRIYRAALGSSGTRPSGGSKLVYLDMEAYRDLRFTVELVKGLLDEPEFSGLSAGVVLQAYIPDSAALQRELTEWAIARCARGGEPLLLRIVKGANLASERVHSSRMGWPLPIYPSKHEVDANYKRMLYFGTDPAHAAAVHLGVASHNIFDLAFGLVLRAARGVEEHVGFELLEGMANSVRKALADLGAPVLVYAPAVNSRELDTAVAYLIRRLDENTASENFLRHSFSMRRGDARYEAEAERFRRAHQAADSVSDLPRRSSNRFADVRDLSPEAAFTNEPDTDLSVAAHRSAVRSALAALERRPTWELASEIDGVRRESGDIADGFDPSRPGVTPYRYHLALRSDLEAAVSVASRALPAWSATSVEERADRVRSVARALRRGRCELIAAMVLDAGKRASEADAEVSEAIDFAEYYSRQLEAVTRDPASPRARAKGVVLVTSPWNFPLAIPLSGVLAALLGGNTVIFKPARETAFVGHLLARVAWAAGVPRDVLSLVFCRDEDGTQLLVHPAIKAVVLTGATSTARFFLEQRPALELHAETGGKNALIISGMADRELAIRDLVASAFGHSGQKCSAASLAILLPELYDDPHFQNELRDAAASLPVGSAWSPESVVTPLIRPPADALRRGLTELDPGESWLLAPRPDPHNPRLWSPGIRFGVAPRSFAHQTELFGPVLSVLRAETFQHALGLANSTPYGLVGGLHSLDEREQARFIEKAECGNLYVNRTITGAVVGRQPFGGHKASSFGPGAKAGGPNYVLQLQDWEEGGAEGPMAPPALIAPLAPLVEWARSVLSAALVERLVARLRSYRHWLDEYFRREHPTDDIVGQDNVLRYRACRALVIVVAPGSSLLDVASSLGAASLCDNELHVSVIAGEGSPLPGASVEALSLACRCAIRAESPAQLAARLAGIGAERLRWLGAPGLEPLDVVLRAAARIGCHVSTRPVLGHGRHELLFNHREQAISRDYHRYGHLGFRSLELAERPPGAHGPRGGGGAERRETAHSRASKTNSSATFSPSGPAARGP